MKRLNPNNQMKKSPILEDLIFLLRSQGSNLGPSGYEPDELPLLYFAIWSAKIGAGNLSANCF